MKPRFNIKKFDDVVNGSGLTYDELVNRMASTPLAQSLKLTTRAGIVNRVKKDLNDGCFNPLGSKTCMIFWSWTRLDIDEYITTKDIVSSWEALKVLAEGGVLKDYDGSFIKFNGLRIIFTEEWDDNEDVWVEYNLRDKTYEVHDWGNYKVGDES